MKSLSSSFSLTIPKSASTIPKSASVIQDLHNRLNAIRQNVEVRESKRKLKEDWDSLQSLVSEAAETLNEPLANWVRGRDYNWRLLSEFYRVYRSKLENTMLSWDHIVKTPLRGHLEKEMLLLNSYIDDQRNSNLKIPLLAAELFAEKMFSFLRDVLACSVEILLKRDSCKGSQRERRVIEKCFATLASQLTRTSGSLVPSPSSAAEPSPAEHPSFAQHDTAKSSQLSYGSRFTRATTVRSSHESSISACQSSFSIVSANKKPEEFKSFRYSSMNTPPNELKSFRYSSMNTPPNELKSFRYSGMNTPSDELTSTSVRYEDTKPPPENSKLGCQRGGNRLRKIRRQCD